MAERSIVEVEGTRLACGIQAGVVFDSNAARYVLALEFADRSANIWLSPQQARRIARWNPDDAAAMAAQPVYHEISTLLVALLACEIFQVARPIPAAVAGVHILGPLLTLGDAALIGVAAAHALERQGH